MAFKAKPAAKSVTDLTSTLNQSTVKTEDKALYQTVFGLINSFFKYSKDTTELIGIMQQEIDLKNNTTDEGIPPFFFMGSS